MMPANPALPKQPPHPIGHLTTYELRDYRRQLEDAIDHIPPGAAVQPDLRRRLDEAIAEQDDRAAIAKAPADA